LHHFQSKGTQVKRLGLAGSVLLPSRRVAKMGVLVRRIDQGAQRDRRCPEEFGLTIRCFFECVAMPVIIDGTNLLWALHEAFEERTITTEMQLCGVLERYFASSEEAGEVVFDGAGPPDQSAFAGRGNLEVVFSGFQTDADTVIEEKIKANTAPRRLTVVSSDRRLRQAAAARKATAVKSERFWEQVQKELTRPKPAEKEPQEKREGLTESETEKWMDLFGLDG